MSLTLSLGVIDFPHGGEAGMTTGDLAGYLENKYHPFRIFYQLNEDRIAGYLSDAVQGALENLLSGAPGASGDPYAAACSKIEADFKAFLAAGVLETLGYPGLPTKAALMGVNHRLKAKKGPRRPSLIDTGQFMAAIKIWTSNAQR